MTDLFPSDKNEIFGDYQLSATFTDNRTNSDRSRNSRSTVSDGGISYVREPYSVPYEEVVKHISLAEKSILDVKSKIEKNLLEKIYVNPYLNPDLEEAHFRVWDEIKMIHSSSGSKIEMQPIAPEYISYEEIVAAEKIGTRACATLVDEYYKAISHATFSYAFDLRMLLNLMYSELLCIKTSIYTDFGGGYDNESQQKVAAQYYSWSKVATHYTERVAKTIATRSKQIPLSEMDQVTEKQTAQLQTIFAIKLNAVDSEIRSLSSALKRDMVDGCEIFYRQYLAPSIRFSKDIVDQLEIDYSTTSMKSAMPFIAGEVLAANIILKGNFISIYADVIERMSNFRDRADNILMYILEKRKYSGYINQLSVKGTKKKNVLMAVDQDGYRNIFKYVPINMSIENNFESNHSKLDNLLDDDHPQYLLRSGGNIEGDVTFSPGATIDGMVLATHGHTGSDGSTRIKASDIDYTVDRNVSGVSNSVIRPLSVSIAQFVPEITNEGIHVCDTIVSIEYDDELLGNHEFEITIVEL